MSKGLVLVTGITGFVGTAVALAFFNEGYSVRGTCRSRSKAEEWIAMFPQHKSKFEYAIVEDIVNPHAFDEAVKGADIIAHTASPFHSNMTDNEKDFLLPAITGTRNLVEATKLEPKIKRVVLTASFSSMINLETFPDKGRTFTDDDWNPATYEQAKTHTMPAFVYSASKVLAERLFWEFIEKEKPSWAGSTICPPTVFGPPLQKITSLDSLNESAKNIWNVVNGSFKDDCPPTFVPIFVMFEMLRSHTLERWNERKRKGSGTCLSGVYARTRTSWTLLPGPTQRLPIVFQKSMFRR